MTYSANYHKAVATSVEILEDSGITEAPIDLNKIIEAYSRTVAVFTYGQFQKMSGRSYSETIAFFKSDQGTCCYEPTSGRYIIYYNETCSDAWIRFTIAHELGHIFLDHHYLAGTNMLSRNFLSQVEYEEYEKEANNFARNLLSPAPLAWDIIQDSKNQNHDIQVAFDITGPAANMRINYIRRDLKDFNSRMKSYISKIFMRYRHYCSSCKSIVPKGSSYCITCGSHRIGKSLWYKEIPAAIPADKNGMLWHCAKCHNDDISEDANFCIICGSPLKNHCIGDSRHGKQPKKHLNSSNARFCADCGSETIFNKYQVFNDAVKEDSIVKYEDGVSYDKDTLKIKICPRCKNEEFSDKAQYCRICSTSLFNYCEGEAEEDYNGNYTGTFINQHANPSNARYCETCGKPTMFFNDKILPDYKNYIEPEETDDELGFDEVAPSLSINTYDDDEIPF